MRWKVRGGSGNSPDNLSGLSPTEVVRARLRLGRCCSPLATSNSGGCHDRAVESR